MQYVFQNFLSYSSINVLSHCRHELPGNVLSACSWRLQGTEDSLSEPYPFVLPVDCHPFSPFSLNTSFDGAQMSPNGCLFSSFFFVVFKARIGYFLVDSVLMPSKDGYLATLKICRFPDSRNNRQLSLDQSFTLYISE